jgi:membrane protein YdbS with pleckstrin-like domain
MLFLLFLQNKISLIFMQLHFTGIIIAVSTFLIIGIFHPIVIKTEYYFGTSPWWIFLVLGIISVAAAFCVANVILSSLLGVLGASLLWSIGELFEQRKRVEKGWFPKKKD